MRCSTVVICSTFIFGSFISATPLPQDDASTVACNIQQTLCLAGASTQDTCNSQHQACIAGAASGAVSVSASGPTTSSAATASIEPTQSVNLDNPSKTIEDASSATSTAPQFLDDTVTLLNGQMKHINLDNAVDREEVEANQVSGDGS
ncbi:hypothetical protein SISNIDRAFT_456978 [Sistotremastrum niveocremeum HHB9708]|uniref:Extracellular membrane protein CFEM domain-containing protein n=2 Tax=Sistotremastraceae TaxID=3402574 RepID=A0A164RYB5_9AGAM|nr:hypothetical protein SISNIDRAFT_456978 [Sistotremastrum niveocremeum HHB9708]KZT33011.1 hypothetical protein SISSUDRAFT_1054726 [Sistotremastrum suecicum HHB10207 ss-3]